MIPNAFKILQLLGSATKVIFIIMFLLISVNCSQSPCISKPIKPNKLFNVAAHGYMAVRNGTIVITEKSQVLYLIAVYMDPAGIRDHRKSSKFFIFDPVARRYICLMNKKKHRFVAKRYPKPNEELCWFLEETWGHGVDVRYVVEADEKEYALRFSKNGKLMRPIATKSLDSSISEVVWKIWNAKMQWIVSAIPSITRSGIKINR